MTTPATASAVTNRLYGFLPQFVQEQDAANGYQFLTWLDGIGSQQQIIDDLVRDTDAGQGWSILLDVTRCPTYALPWLGQFLGIRFQGDPSDVQMRQQIVNPPSWNRGTIDALRLAAQMLMVPGAQISIIERYPDPYSITILVPSAQLIGLNYAELDASYLTYAVLDAAFPTYADFTQNSAQVQAALLAALPAGIIPYINFY